ncbi:MAG: hypothetical protein A2233_04420 [Candidatus Kerfeldbacteria bacterium RIFOXYA2_FULL_38_24]|uniref:Uncharacterized protein n=1 Tax=Candidatus Kerfeldbacteria bacterium RIFOXYB2_FULL_38_14 TaxID=1798547 RepID=A0A1G2BAV5_9BACT|nr:MAG: hypothetical protein A2233_04420 [Candidatus Kerfeldbacteria bacterium RIFOXYA2_FULL_38_24]OGY86343.1 MAG: hypothetical protein A2319_03020 [Candidatus Kerfeldbacteria bacterium RIFOXYB2_FULL_38_14]OGY89860.1 MAG: hypothetical protein A2458_05030 [Candidatus Kerfeldbacteria bacterium RIFOXYC2_FULL_38_9]
MSILEEYQSFSEAQKKVVRTVLTEIYEPPLRQRLVKETSTDDDNQKALWKHIADVRQFVKTGENVEILEALNSILQKDKNLTLQGIFLEYVAKSVNAVVCSELTPDEANILYQDTGGSQLTDEQEAEYLSYEEDEKPEDIEAGNQAADEMVIDNLKAANEITKEIRRLFPEMPIPELSMAVTEARKALKKHLTETKQKRRQSDRKFKPTWH